MSNMLLPDRAPHVRHDAAMADEPAAAPTSERDVLRDQWGHVIDTTRVLLGLMIQAWGFLAAADSALLAFGLSQDSRNWALFVAATMPALMAAVALVVSYLASPLVYTGLVTEKRLGVPAGPLIGTFAVLRADEFLKAVLEVDPHLEGTATSLPRVPMRGRLILMALCLVVLAQLLLALGLTLS
jgi:hypothetical protein